MWSLFNKGASDDLAWRGPHRLHIDETGVTENFRRHLDGLLSHLYQAERRVAVICIGTDRSTGDCLGPLIGTKLSATLPAEITVLGTLDRPVHAVNLQEALDCLYAATPNAFVIAIDACLGRTESIGIISLKEGPLQPGTGVNKTLPPVGDLHVIGIVNVGGFMEYLVLQNTRLSLVMRMAEVVAEGVRAALCDPDCRYGRDLALPLGLEAAVAAPEPV